VKGKDFYFKKAGYISRQQTPEMQEWMQRSTSAWNYTPYDYNGPHNELVESMRVDKMAAAYEKFKQTRPMVAALLEHLFQKAAFKVFQFFPADMSEGQATEILHSLNPITELESEERYMRAISNHIGEEIA